jgi:hypothetical protein
VNQPQWYAIPAGLYFIAVGFLERQRSRPLFANLVEGFGLAVLLVPSFIQSLSGSDGFYYFLLLLFEALAVTLWAASQRLKIPFFAGIGASALNVVAQVVVLVSIYQVSRWYIIGGVGLLLVTIAIFVERKRENISEQAELFLGTMDRWQ